MIIYVRIDNDVFPTSAKVESCGVFKVVVTSMVIPFPDKQNENIKKNERKYFKLVISYILRIECLVLKCLDRFKISKFNPVSGTSTMQIGRTHLLNTLERPEVTYMYVLTLIHLCT